MSSCTHKRCVRKIHARKLCAMHYQRQRNGVDMDAPEQKKGPYKPKACKEPGCKRKVYGRGHCRFHWERLRNGRDLSKPKKRRNPGEWSEWYVGNQGYVVRTCRLADGRKLFESEHRVVMEAMLGRKMIKGENVHHKNGVRHDNRPSNLELWVSKQPAGQRPEDLLAWAHEIISLYERPEGRLD